MVACIKHPRLGSLLRVTVLRPSQELPHLVDHFVNKFKPLYDQKEISLTEDAMAVLKQYGWPGNVRELENVIELFLRYFEKEPSQPSAV